MSGGSPADPLVIGRINGVYGIKGWVRIHSYTEPEENLLGYKNCKIRRGSQWQDIEFDAGRRQGKGLIAHIAGVDTRNDAEALKGELIAVQVEELPSLDEDEFYWHQLEGLSVLSAGALLGRVDHLLATGSNDVLVVKPSEGSIDKQERLIPWLMGSVVKKVDIAAGEIDVDWDPEF